MSSLVDLSKDNDNDDDKNETTNDNGANNDEDDDYLTTDDEVNDEEIDEYLQNKGCDAIISASQVTRPKRVIFIRDRSEANMLNEMRSKNSRKRKSQVKKTSSKPKAEYLKRDYGTKDQMLMRWKENDPSSTSKDPNIVKDGTLQYQLWGGRYVLFCTICLCPVSAHKVKTQRHLDASKASNSHQVRMREVREKRLFLVDLYKHLSVWIRKNWNIQGVNISYDLHMFRLNTVYNFMKAGLPMNSINELREYLEGINIDRQRLTSANHLGIYIPIIETAENENILSYVRTVVNEHATLDSDKYRYNPTLIIFDGTTRVDEVVCIVARFVLSDFTIVQKLISLRRYRKCKTAEELFFAIKFELLERYGFRPSQIYGFQKDRAAANEAAYKEYLKPVFQYARNLHCVSHTMNHVGDHSKHDLLTKVTQDVQGMCNQHGGNNKASLRWLDVFHERWRNPGNTRWWCKFELTTKIYEEFPVFVRYINGMNDDEDVMEGDDGRKFIGKRIGRLKDIINNTTKRLSLKLEAAVVSIVFKRVVEATFILEGDGPCSIITYDMIMDLLEFFEDNIDIPNEQLNFHLLEPVLNECMKEEINSKEISEKRTLSKAEIEQVEKRVRKQAFDVCIKAYEYFEKTIYNIKDDGATSKLHDDMCIYYLCSFMDPISFRSKYRNECPDFDETILEYIKDLHIFKEEQVLEMKNEWKTYWRRVMDINPTEDDGKPKYRMDAAHMFWKEWNKNKLDNLMLLAKYAFLIVPSSAASERVFSVLKHSLSLVQMYQALEDRTEIQVKTRYNHRQYKWHDDKNSIVL